MADARFNKISKDDVAWLRDKARTRGDALARLPDGYLAYIYAHDPLTPEVYTVLATPDSVVRLVKKARRVDTTGVNERVAGYLREQS